MIFGTLALLRNERTTTSSGLAVTLTLASILTSQGPIFEQWKEMPLKEHLPRLELAVPTLAFSDVDGDGDPDLLAGVANQPLQVWSNRGDGVFRESGEVSAVGSAREIHACDLDGDGDDDVIAIDQQRRLKYLGNFGGGNFIDVTAGLFGGPNQMSAETVGAGLLLGDVDGDGAIDVLLGDRRLFLNDGLGRFTERVGAAPINTRRSGFLPFLFDYDADGDVDLIQFSSGPTQVFRNSGAGDFVEVTAGFSFPVGGLKLSKHGAACGPRW